VEGVRVGGGGCGGGVLGVRFCEIIEDCLENTAAGYGLGII
jgi:hypothetical protein